VGANLFMSGVNSLRWGTKQCVMRMERGSWNDDGEIKRVETQGFLE